MKFPYRKLTLPKPSSYFGPSILRPIIPIRVTVSKKEIQYAALIDSGADFCILDAEIGEYLGLDIQSGQREKFGGIQKRNGEGATAFLHNVALNIGGWDYYTTVGFSYDIAPYGCGVLGQKGFFDIFVVKFDLIKEDIELKERR